MHDLSETIESMCYLIVLYSRDNLSDCVKLVWIYDAGSKKGIRWRLSAGCLYRFEGQHPLLHQQILNLMLLWEWGLSRNKSLFGCPPWAEFCIYHSWVGNEIKIYDRCLHHLNEVELSNLRVNPSQFPRVERTWNVALILVFRLSYIEGDQKALKIATREVNTWRVVELSSDI